MPHHDPDSAQRNSDGLTGEPTDGQPITLEATTGPATKQAPFFEESGNSPPVPADGSLKEEETSRARRSVQPVSDAETPALGNETTDLAAPAGTEATDG